MAKTDLCTTEARRAEIEARCEAATRGPHWTVVMGGLIAHSGVALEPDDWEPDGDTARWSLHNLTDGDADMFNVAAVDLPDLLADVTTLLAREVEHVAEIAGLSRAIADLNDACVALSRERDGLREQVRVLREALEAVCVTYEEMEARNEGADHDLWVAIDEARQALADTEPSDG